MGRADLDRALRRSGEYFYEDGLFEIVVGLWIGLTVALPLFLFGWAKGDKVLWVFVTGLLIRPAILAAKERWVHPRTGRVAYPDPANVSPTLTSLGLSPATRPAVGPAPGQWAATYFHPGILVGFMMLGVELSRHLGIWGAGGHMLIGSLLSGCLLLAGWRWRQRRWIALGLALALLATAVASSGLGWERALALHAAGIAFALIASGTVAFLGYLRHAPRAGTNGR
jgi:hypothetical protein